MRTWHDKNIQSFGNCPDSKRTRKNIPANIKTYLSWQSDLQLILNLTMLLFSRWKMPSHSYCYCSLMQTTSVCKKITTRYCVAFKKTCLHSITFFSFHTMFIFSFRIKVIPLKFHIKVIQEIAIRNGKIVWKHGPS